MKNHTRYLIFPLILCGIFACGGENVLPDEGKAPSPIPIESAAQQKPSLRFFTFGDWGTGTQSQIDVAAALGSECQSKGCDFGLLLGDNFYPAGVSSITDQQWQSKFEDIYPDLDLPFYVVLGNHDYDGNEQAEIDYSQTQNRWKLPARAYSIAFPAGASQALLEIFVIDSNAFDANAASALQQALANSTATWKVLALHHPIYSNGLHGDDSAGINSLLLPVICQGIDIVLSGHDHLFSHMEDPNDACDFPQFVVGSGGKDLYPTHPDTRAIFSESSFGYAVLAIDPDSLHLEFRRDDGSLAYQYDQMK